MRAGEVLADGFGRIGEELRAALDGADDELLVRRPDPHANTLAWLAWHVARVQDAQIAPLAGTEAVWTAQGWAQRFGLPFDDAATGYGQSPADVAQVRAPADLLLGYLEATTAQTLAYLERLEDGDLDVVVDEDWDPPVTLGVRLVSILADDLEHTGQASYLRGVLDRTA
ncbi:mycothiol transferase [Cellulomonas shaoxiangyii]|uniref:DUF664 domain-containing protein n=1 Tax=Cellulomonas shaoxiangyii TaxID=2566013 RepID=A0A4P7SIX7_9CELL|nr:DUF664 domain-containing protein [Cellulomonas shaoxiangyii]QCB92443.1 DUF664 domain-containing protein [Cellulomonas shaoxiangyii]TGY85646.1 DUF664 domain-containing protein [Cellulomonas shaoxiangyii]